MGGGGFDQRWGAAVHLEQTLQGLHHLLFAEGVQPGLAWGVAPFQLPHCGAQAQRCTLQNAQS